MSLLPQWFWLLAVFVFGAIIGSFLNVYIYRFHTGKSLNGRSHCMSCGMSLRWFELFPIASYVGLRGRCRTCKCRVTPRYLIVEVVTGLLFVASALVAASWQELIFVIPFVTVLVVITVYDYYHFIIPDELIAALTVLVTSWLGYQWLVGELTGLAIGYLLLAAFLGAAFFFALWFISRGQWLGFGDVKLAVPLGLWVGAGGIFSFIVLSFWVGAALSILLILFQAYGRGQQQLHLGRQRLTMKSAVPFAPFMIIGAGLVYFLQLNVLSLFSFT